MKRIITMLMVAMLPLFALTLNSCGSDSPEPTNPDATAEQLVVAIKGHYNVTLSEKTRAVELSSMTMTPSSDGKKIKVDFKGNLNGVKFEFVTPDVTPTGKTIQEVEVKHSDTNVTFAAKFVGGEAVTLTLTSKVGGATKNMTGTGQRGDAPAPPSLVEQAMGTYDSTIDVTLYQEDVDPAVSPTSTATIILTPSTEGENMVDLSLKGFEFPGIGLIPIEIPNVLLTDGGGKISINHATEVNIELAPGFGTDVPITIVGDIVESKMDLALMVILDEGTYVDVKVAGTKK